MIPILYAADAMKNNKTETLGLGFLVECTKCEVMEKRNADYTATLSYPANGRLAKLIKAGMFVRCGINVFFDNLSIKTALFKLTKVSLQGDSLELEAEHISYMLEDAVFFPPVLECNNVTAKEAMAILKEHAIGDVPFQFVALFKNETRNTFKFDLTKNTSIRKALGGSEGSLLTHFNGDYFFLDKFVGLIPERVGDMGRYLIYGRDVVSPEFDEEITNTYTAILPFAKKEDESIITLPEKVLLSDNAKNFPSVIYRAVEFTEGVDSVDSLRKKGLAYIKNNNIGVPNVHLSVKLLDLQKAKGFRYDPKIGSLPQLCETVTVLIPHLRLKVKAKITEMVWDSLRNEIVSIVLGDSKEGLYEYMKERTINTSAIASIKEEVQTKADKYLVSEKTGKRYEWRIIEQDGVVKPQLVEV